MNDTPLMRYMRLQREESILPGTGFNKTDRGNWTKDGIEYDLSAADLDQIDLIIARGLFVVGVCHSQ